jgi:isocitrate lyase
MTWLTADQLEKDWKENPRWKGVVRPYSAKEVVSLRGSLPIEHSIATHTAQKLWKYLHEQP